MNTILVRVATVLSLVLTNTFAFQPAALHPCSPRVLVRISSPTLQSVGRAPPPAAPLHMVKAQDLMEQLPSKTVIDFVEQSETGSVVASDVAAQAGVSLSTARKDLTALAALSQADLAVSSDGEILYKFPRNINAVLAQKSAKYKAVQTFQKAWPLLFWLVRCTFGVALLASLVAIFSTIFFLQSSSSSDDDRRRDDRGFGGGGGGGLSWYWGPSPFDFFYYRPYGAYGYYGTGVDYRDPEEMGFLESIFSYVFGDGNPNAGLEEKRLSLAANMIRENNGAVTAEQLAPFVDEAPSPQTVAESTYVDESFVLPIVSALAGEPFVTEEGEIVYVFPELQKSASKKPTTKSLPSAAARESSVLKRAGLNPKTSSREIAQVLNYNGISTRGAVERGDLIDLLQDALPPMSPVEEAELIDSDPKVLQEREWKFSLASDLNKFLAAGLGALNLGGALYLGNLLGQYALYYGNVRLPSYMGTVQTFFPALLGYAVLFNIIPLVRNLWIKQQNAKIQQRNKRRKSWQAALAAALKSNNRIAKKLEAASKMKTKMRRIGAGQDDIVFDTSKPIEENAVKIEKKRLEEFDKLLEREDASNKPFQ